MNVGLTLGKFAPLHRGHQLLIETALEETDHVLVLIYDVPETTPVPLPVRAGWIRALYPSAEVIEAWNGPTVVGDTPKIKQMHEDYILSVLNGRRVTHFFSSEFYGEHVSQALEAIDRRVDPRRAAFPVSGTAVREDPHEHRRFLSPVVYRDLVKWVVFLGAPSTGKSTLAQALAEAHDTVWMPEYGREYWLEHQADGRLSLEQLVEIAEGHRRREDDLMLEAKRYFFVDTDATTTYMFSLDYHGFAHPELSRLADETRQRYDLFVLCEDDIPYDDTWDRSGEVHRAEFQTRIRADLRRRGIPFVSVRGSVEERVSQVVEKLTKD